MKRTALLLSLLAAGCAGRAPAQDASSPKSSTADSSEQSRADRSVSAYQRACELGSARGRNDPGAKYLDGDGVPRDEGRAAVLLRKSCSGPLPMGGFHYGCLLHDGRGV